MLEGIIWTRLNPDSGERLGRLNAKGGLQHYCLMMRVTSVFDNFRPTPALVTAAGCPCRECGVKCRSARMVLWTYIPFLV